MTLIGKKSESRLKEENGNSAPSQAQDEDVTLEACKRLVTATNHVASQCSKYGD